MVRSARATRCGARCRSLERRDRVLPGCRQRGLPGPLRHGPARPRPLCEPVVSFFKAFYRRPCSGRRALRRRRAGEPARPRARRSRCSTQLAAVATAARRRVAARRAAQSMPFATGYGVEPDADHAGAHSARRKPPRSTSTSTATRPAASALEPTARDGARHDRARLRKRAAERAGRRARGAGRSRAPGRRLGDDRGGAGDERAPRGAWRPRARRAPPVPGPHGTPLGRGASPLHDGEGDVSIDGARRGQACLRAELEVAPMSGRRRGPGARGRATWSAALLSSRPAPALVLDGEDTG